MTTDDALTELRAELALWGPDWHVTSLTSTFSWGTFADDGSRPEGVGWYRSGKYGPSWVVQVEQEGWDEDRGRFLDGATTIALAAIKVRDHMKHRREDPHYGHIVDQWLVADCADCDRDAIVIGVVDEPRPVYV